ncbi:MAG: hypothetical protein V3V01_12840 [Acidimicrobiales bacterium]
MTVGAPAAGENQPIGDPRANFVDCADPPKLNITPEGILSFVEEWVHLRSVLQAERVDLATRLWSPATVLSTEGKTYNIEIHNAMWSGVDWALANGGAVWIALNTPVKESEAAGIIPRSSYVIATDSSGVAFIPGACEYFTVYEPLAEQRGDAETQKLLLGIRGKTGAALNAALASPEPVGGGLEAVTLLHPGDVDEEFLESLTSGLFHFMLLSELAERDSVICTKIPAGWNDCLLASEALGGAAIEGYLDESGQVEVWQLDEVANPHKPIRLLGQFEISAADMRGGELAMRIEINPSKASIDAVQVLETIDMKDVDDSTDWPGLFDRVEGLPEPKVEADENSSGE